MKKIKTILLAVVFLNLTNCSTENHEFPLDKRYWDTNDYANAIRELKYGYEPDEKLPTFNDPESRIIIEKFSDQQNFNIVLDDNELGIKHRSEVAETFFNRWKDMNSIYIVTNRQDKFIYDIEMLKVFHFGLGLQLKYFKLGNDVIKENADDPNSIEVKNNFNSNVNTLIGNYIIYLDEINNEKSYSDKGKELFAIGIDKYFTELIELYPKANYDAMERKIDLMLKKSNSEKIKTSLTKIKQLIESKK